MTWSSIEIIDLIFVPIYFILFLAALYAFIKHAHNKRVTFGLLFLFPLIRCVGNILLVAAMQEQKKSNPNVNTLTDLYTGGFVLQLAGFGLLFSAALNLTKRASLYVAPVQNGGGRGGLIDKIKTPAGFLHLVNTVSNILLIVGLTNSTSSFSPTSANKASIDVLAKVGIIMLLVATVLLTVLTIYHLFIKGPLTPSARTILTFVAIACVPMIARMAWSTYRVAANNLIGANIWASLVLQYIAESVATAIFVALSFVLDARGGDADLDERKTYNDRAQNAYNSTAPNTQFATEQASSPGYAESKSAYTYPPQQAYQAA
ncbi:uncharacterized protein FA14DRAFT_52461 [Meira miltonrushii]|uniref:DUF7702 domain-containing protein n=1 Tax=Meira miltonrushii TaxID=1280837 RepID=A0A316VEX0_9BASI|nr:uncharacterized protein FA14DRAFT_52461 [Meira miltonrushii]PWN36177.1 hypothetical protein FA14DRAFT_52461 [Meira miltonrushii]